MENAMIFISVFFALFAGFGAGIKFGWDARRKSDEYDRQVACREQRRKNHESFMDNYKNCYE